MLRLDGVSKQFGGIVAVSDVTVDLGDAGVTGLVGPNGSGKTTLFHLITGFYTMDSGRIFFQGEPIHGLPPHRISQKGIVRTFQHTRTLPCLTVQDNLMAAAPNQAGERIVPLFFKPALVRGQESGTRFRAEDVLNLLKLSHLADQPAGRLSYGQQKLLELGRVLMARPRLILLDEPTAGVNPAFIRRIISLVRELRDRGTRFFLVEHNMSVVAGLCERVLVMDSGLLIFSGTPEESRRDPRVVEAYLGREDHVV